MQFGHIENYLRIGLIFNHTLMFGVSLYGSAKKTNLYHTILGNDRLKEEL